MSTKKALQLLFQILAFLPLALILELYLSIGHLISSIIVTLLIVMTIMLIYGLTVKDEDIYEFIQWLSYEGFWTIIVGLLSTLATAFVMQFS